MQSRIYVITSIVGIGLMGLSISGVAATLRCDPDGIGTSSHGATAAQHAAVQPEKTPAEATIAQPEIAAAAKGTTTPTSTGGGGGSSAPDAGGLGDGAPIPHKHGLRWQSFLPGMIK